ncbi:unnamed protein product [Nezara viridula]|uniref:Uncharacterized protein n=1 Tax=Nezara viridula TaxID=85310 RepID=A0A9P0E884_NEZVI|nr:unnamed protein product [Nezara viridula]
MSPAGCGNGLEMSQDGNKHALIYIQVAGLHPLIKCEKGGVVQPGFELPRRTPPPPYPLQLRPPVKYNRRNNPELEKRRIHHCTFLGKLDVILLL